MVVEEGKEEREGVVRLRKLVKELWSRGGGLGDGLGMGGVNKKGPAVEEMQG